MKSLQILSIILLIISCKQESKNTLHGIPLTNEKTHILSNDDFEKLCTQMKNHSVISTKHKLIGTTIFQKLILKKTGKWFLIVSDDTAPYFPEDSFEIFNETKSIKMKIAFFHNSGFQNWDLNKEEYYYDVFNNKDNSKLKIDYASFNFDLISTDPNIKTEVQLFNQIDEEWLTNFDLYKKKK